MGSTHAMFVAVGVCRTVLKSCINLRHSAGDCSSLHRQHRLIKRPHTAERPSRNQQSGFGVAAYRYWRRKRDRVTGNLLVFTTHGTSLTGWREPVTSEARRGESGNVANTSECLECARVFCASELCVEFGGVCVWCV